MLLSSATSQSSPVLKLLAALSAEEAAVLMLGWEIVREQDGRLLGGKIVETEAYHQDDAAAHSFRGQTQRNAVMFGPAGRAYVYFTYGMHYCFNVVCGPVGRAESVLIRALEPLTGIELMLKNRLSKALSRSDLDSREATNGPAKLCQALVIDKRFNGHDLSLPPLKLIPRPPLPSTRITTATRIGITRNKDALLRYYIKDNPYVSKK